MFDCVKLFVIGKFCKICFHCICKLPHLSDILLNDYAVEPFFIIYSSFSFYESNLLIFLTSIFR